MRLTLILISVLFTACATHAPMSQTIVLSSKKKSISTKGLSSKFTMPSDGGELSNQPEENERTYKNNLGINYFKTFLIDDSASSNGAISLSLGKATGVDVTFKIIEPIFISGGVSFPENFFFSMPIRLVETEIFGISIAPVFRQESFHFEEENFNYYKFIIPDGYKNFKLLGSKVHFLSVPYTIIEDYDRGFMSLILEGGVFLDIDDYYLSVGFSFGY